MPRLPGGPLIAPQRRLRRRWGRLAFGAPSAGPAVAAGTARSAGRAGLDGSAPGRPGSGSAARAASSLSARGRETSLARMAASTVTFIPRMPQ